MLRKYNTHVFNAMKSVTDNTVRETERKRGNKIRFNKVRRKETRKALNAVVTAEVFNGVHIETDKAVHAFNEMAHTLVGENK